MKQKQAGSEIEGKVRGRDILLVKIALDENSLFWTVRAETMQEAEEQARLIDSDLGCFMRYTLPSSSNTIPDGKREYNVDKFKPVEDFIRENAARYNAPEPEDESDVRAPKVYRVSAIC